MVLGNDNADLDGVEAADVADNAHFTIDEDGILKFSDPPDFENPSGEGDAVSNTYKVVVLASDAATDGGMMGYHKVTVEVTNVNEPGKSPWPPAPQMGRRSTWSAQL